MPIDGPFTLSIVQRPEYLGTELQLDFTAAFQAMLPEARAAAVQEYPDTLARDIEALPEDDPERQGMLAVRQIAEEIYPHVAEDALELDEAITIQIQPDSPLAALGGPALH